MRATRSAITGVCIFGSSDETTRLVCADPAICDDMEAYQPLGLSVISDWGVVEGATQEVILEEAVAACRAHRAVDLLRIALGGVEASIATEILDDVNTSLQTQVAPRALLSLLLVAPLKDVATLEQLVSACLSSGYAALAHVLDQLRDLQPLLRRFANAWRDVHDLEFAASTRTRDELWQHLSESGKLVDLLQAPNESKFSSAWNLMAFEEGTPPARAALARVGKALARRLAGQGLLSGAEARSLEPESDESVDDSQTQPPKTRAKPWVLYARVIKQIDAVGAAVAAGDDRRAQIFLRQLVEEQTADAESPQYAIKSLCNIAQRCAEMFRTDFERTCLNKALDLDPHDPWLLVQFGDHLKRTGAYSEAIDILTQAVPSEPVLAPASIADVYAHKGDYEHAIECYKAIPGWSEDPHIRTAIADNLRRQGKFDEALAMYDVLSQEGYASDRVAAGRAEIAKRQGQLPAARQLYQDLLKDPDLGTEALHVYRIALAGVLKQMDELPEAYRVIDEVVHGAPFDMRARSYRASILGLMGRAQEGLNDLPYAAAPRAVGEWIRHFYFGVLLLMLRRFTDARKQLVENLRSALILGEDNAVMRLGAAVALLMQHDVGSAQGILEGLPAVHDQYTTYFGNVLRLHVAVAQHNHDRIAELVRQLEEVGAPNRNLAALYRAVGYLKNGDLRRAEIVEVKALLRLAA